MRISKIDSEKLNLKLQEDIKDRTKVKRSLFIFLLIVSFILSILILSLLWYIPYVGIKNIHPLASWIWGGVIFSISAFIMWSCSGLLISILFKKEFLFSKKIRGITIKLFFPFILLVGKLFGISQSKVRASFIKINNDLVSWKNQKFDPKEVLILIPHCLQNSRCKIRITYDIENCKRCGMCSIAYILKLRDRFSIDVAIATGGTIARRIVVQKRPKFIIAVACERDLASGIQDTYPLPVFGIINERPYGPCIDTQVSIELLEKAIKQFVRIHA